MDTAAKARVQGQGRCSWGCLGGRTLAGVTWLCHAVCALLRFGVLLSC